MGGGSVDLSGKLVLVTGATRGIGRAVAIAAAAAGAELIISGRTVGALEEADDAIRAAGGRSGGSGHIWCRCWKPPLLGSLCGNQGGARGCGTVMGWRKRADKSADQYAEPRRHGDKDARLGISRRESRDTSLARGYRACFPGAAGDRLHASWRAGRCTGDAWPLISDPCSDPAECRRVAPGPSVWHAPAFPPPASRQEAEPG